MGFFGNSCVTCAVKGHPYGFYSIKFMHWVWTKLIATYTSLTNLTKNGYTNHKNKWTTELSESDNQMLSMRCAMFASKLRRGDEFKKKIYFKFLRFCDYLAIDSNEKKTKHVWNSNRLKINKHKKSRRVFLSFWSSSQSSLLHNLAECHTFVRQKTWGCTTLCMQCTNISISKENVHRLECMPL